jgi:heme/copper-type cytochrome/quinol oxidase subunit 3
MSAETISRTLPIDGNGRRALGWWGMILLVMTEAAFFATLLFAYFDLLARNPDWPPGGAPHLRLSLLNTVLLLSSSLTFAWAEAGIRVGSGARLRWGLLTTFLLGAVFLTVQGFEYAEQAFTPATHAYGSLFFTITGFHGAHVAVGLLMLLVVQARAWLGHFDAEGHLAVKVTGLYWHFVDAVWIAVFTSLYLSPRFLGAE